MNTNELKVRLHKAHRDTRPEYAGIPFRTLMYRYYWGAAEAAINILDSIEIMKLAGTPTEVIVEITIDRLQHIADHSIIFMEGNNNGQRESDHT